MEKKITLATVQSRWKSAIEQIFPGFKADAENEQVIKLIQLYISRDIRFETAVKDKTYSLHKGLLLHGNYGTGKTKLMQIVQRCLYLMQSDIMFRRFNMRELCQQYQSEGASALSPDNRHWFVDEFGLTERESANSYGNKIIVGDELIGVRYDRFQAGYMTHLTTNLTYQQMNDFYNPRTISRLHEMCNFIPLDGSDRRLTAKPAPVINKERKPLLTESEAEYAWKQTILNRFKAFKATGILHLEFPSYVLKWFEEKKIIKISNTQKEEIFEQAKVRVAEQKRMVRLNPKSKYELNKASAFIKRFEEDLLTQDDKQEVKTEAAFLIMKGYFESIKELNF